MCMFSLCVCARAYCMCVCSNTVRNRASGALCKLSGTEESVSLQLVKGKNMGLNSSHMAAHLRVMCWKGKEGGGALCQAEATGEF